MTARSESASRVEPEWLDVRGARVTVRRHGSGEPLLFLHGTGLTGRWLPIHEALSQRFDVIAPEHPGFGQTERPSWYRRLDDMVLHYADLLDALGLESVHLVGHSFGGRLAGAFAAVFPDRVRTLTLVTPAPLEPGGENQWPDWDPDADFDQLLFNGNKDSYPDYLEADDLGLTVAGDEDDPHADPDAWSIDAPPTLYRQLARVGCPSIVIVPDEDRVFPRELFEQWAAHIPDARIVEVRGRDHPTGHLLMVQEPDAVAEEIARLRGIR